MRGGRAIAAAALALAAAGCGRGEEEARAPVRPVLVTEVRPRTERVFGPFAGKVDPRTTTNEGFRTSGRMIARDVNVGDRVAKDQRLALLDETMLTFAVVQAGAGVANAEAQLKNADAANARKQILARTQAVPRSEVDTASADQQTAAAQLDQARVALQKARDNLGYAGLLAEFDAVVMAWDAEIGQDVAEGQAVVTLARPDVLEAVVDIPDDLIGEVRDKDAFTVVLQAATQVSARGTVREIAPRADDATRTRQVRFALERPPFAFHIGSIVTVQAATPIPPRVEIPEAALLERDGAVSVWVVAPGAESVALRPVAIVDRGGGLARVTGLADGDRVVRAGIHSLKDGQAVRVATSFP